MNQTSNGDSPFDTISYELDSKKGGEPSEQAAGVCVYDVPNPITFENPYVFK